MPDKPPPKSPSKAMVYGLAIGATVLSKLPKLISHLLTPEPRTCPKCSYRMVEQVGKFKTKGGKNVAYWRCSACAARYRSMAEGPLSTPSANEWQKRVGLRFPR